MSAKPNSTKSDALLNPGPGQYDYSSVNRPKSPSYRIGSAKREALYKFLEQNPGPGQYAPDSNGFTRPKSPTWKIGTGQRPPLSQADLNPGPGNYELAGRAGLGPKVNNCLM